MNRRVARQIGDLHEQLRVATTGLRLPEAAPTIRAHHGPDGRVDGCELWARIGYNPNLRRLCALSTGVGLRRPQIEKAAENRGFTHPRDDGQESWVWHETRAPLDTSLTGPWFDLPLTLPGLPRTPASAGVPLPQHPLISNNGR